MKIATGVLVASLSAAAAFAQEKPKAQADAVQSAQVFSGNALIAGLKATPGCLGVETARTMSGKNVIFAWFEDKKAVLNWYYSDTHQRAMKAAFPGNQPRKPLADVPDDSGPIMAVASITLGDKPQFEGTSLPISQISIELYRPLAGGLFLGGRFAPEGLKVPGVHDYTPGKK